jgi:hypothetical protein
MKISQSRGFVKRAVQRFNTVSAVGFLWVSSPLCACFPSVYPLLGSCPPTCPSPSALDFPVSPSILTRTCVSVRHAQGVVRLVDQCGRESVSACLPLGSLGCQFIKEPKHTHTPYQRSTALAAGAHVQPPAGVASRKLRTCARRAARSAIPGWHPWPWPCTAPGRAALREHRECTVRRSLVSTCARLCGQHLAAGAHVQPPAGVASRRPRTCARCAARSAPPTPPGTPGPARHRRAALREPCTVRRGSVRVREMLWTAPRGGRTLAAACWGRPLPAPHVRPLRSALRTPWHLALHGACALRCGSTVPCTVRRGPVRARDAVDSSSRRAHACSRLPGPLPAGPARVTAWSNQLYARLSGQGSIVCCVGPDPGRTGPGLLSSPFRSHGARESPRHRPILVCVSLYRVGTPFRTSSL